MPVTLDATLGGASSNSYGSLAAAEEVVTQFAAVPGLGVSVTAWQALSGGDANDKKSNALIFAAIRVDGCVFPGSRMSDSQAREFPRLGTGRAAYDAVVPSQVFMAQVADACFLVSSLSDLDRLVAQGVQSYQLGQMSVSFDPSLLARLGALAPAAEAILRSADLVPGSCGFVRVGRR